MRTLNTYKVMFRVVGFDWDNEQVLMAFNKEQAASIAIKMFKEKFINLEVIEDSILVLDWN